MEVSLEPGHYWLDIAGPVMPRVAGTIDGTVRAMSP